MTNDELQTKVQTERDNGDEVIVEAVFWDHRLVSVDVQDWSRPSMKEEVD